MAALPANSTFLPVLDDLLSPDFRPPALPVQTPQTPVEVTHGVAIQSKVKTPSAPMNGVNNAPCETNEAASRIQNWWKMKRYKSTRSQSVDLTAERAKNFIRVNRTEDHVRYLEAEVGRLKSALIAERKLRSLQLEAIRSLWNQMQKISSTLNAPDGSMMTQSMPNGLAEVKPESAVQVPSTKTMSQSLCGTVGEVSNTNTNSSCCPCATEIHSVKESISELKLVIENLKLSKLTEEGDVTSNSDPVCNEDTSENKMNSQTKRPSCLDLSKSGGKLKYKVNTNTDGHVLDSNPQVSGYANEMASKLIEDAVEREEESSEQGQSKS